MGTSGEPRTWVRPTGVATPSSCRSGYTDAIGNAAALLVDDTRATASAYADARALTTAWTDVGAYTDAGARTFDEASDDTSADASVRAYVDASACACTDAWAYAVVGICGHIYDITSIRDHISEYDVYDERLPV